MPISKEMLARYPSNWKEISARIRFKRAGGRCEKCGSIHMQPHPITGSKVILATAHLNHKPEDNRECNLMALCQRCHLLYDMWYHRACKLTLNMFGVKYARYVKGINTGRQEARVYNRVRAVDTCIKNRK